MLSWKTKTSPLMSLKTFVLVWRSHTCSWSSASLTEQWWGVQRMLFDRLPGSMQRWSKISWKSGFVHCREQQSPWIRSNLPSQSFMCLSLKFCREKKQTFHCGLSCLGPLQCIGTYLILIINYNAKIVYGNYILQFRCMMYNDNKGFFLFFFFFFFWLQF